MRGRIRANSCLPFGEVGVRARNQVRKLLDFGLARDGVGQTRRRVLGAVFRNHHSDTLLLDARAASWSAQLFSKMLVQRFLTWLYRTFGHPRLAKTTFAEPTQLEPLSYVPNALEPPASVQVAIQQDNLSNRYTEDSDPGSHRATGGSGAADMASRGLADDLRVSSASDGV